MTHPRRPIALVLFLMVASTAARGDDSLAPDVARKLKDATVYVKVAYGPLTVTGSGFVIQASGGSALIATNHHVVTKPKLGGPLGFIPGVRGRDRIALMQIQRTLAANEPAVSVVFRSGEPDEQVVKAEVLCGLEDPDLAVLRVPAPKVAPPTIEFRRASRPSETMPVFILGFPFGEAIHDSKANPTITIGRGSVSNLQKDAAGKLAKVQIDGALNPGNSGGPVVDARGELVGVAVQSIPGSNIGRAVPAAEVATVLDGGLGKATLATTGSVNGAAAKYVLAVPVLDPLKKLKSATVRFVPKAVPADAAKAGKPQLPADATSRDLDLAAKGGVAKVELPLDPKARQVTVQASVVTADGKTVHLDPQVVDVPAAAKVTTTTDGKGSTTTTIVEQTPDGRTVRRQMTVTRGGGAGGNNPAGPGGAKDSPYKVGDKVIVKWAGRDETAEVIGFIGTGWVRVKFPRDGIELTPVLPPAQLKPVAGAKPAAEANAKKKAPAGSELLTWKSQGNRFTIKARFVELKDGAVVLEKENGETVTVPLDKLAPDEQKLARRLAEDAEENPFATPAGK